MCLVRLDVGNLRWWVVAVYVFSGNRLVLIEWLVLLPLVGVNGVAAVSSRDEKVEADMRGKGRGEEGEIERRGGSSPLFPASLFIIPTLSKVPGDCKRGKNEPRKQRRQLSLFSLGLSIERGGPEPFFV